METNFSWGRWNSVGDEQWFMAAKPKEERGSERGLLSNTWKCTVQGDTHADKARVEKLYWKRVLGQNEAE